ncbi:MAG: thioredoxin family protein [Chlamydiales bacterium]
MRIFFLCFLFHFCLVYGWESDYSQALEKSREDKKPLLLFFTGSDWSVPSMKIRNEILNSEGFQQKIRQIFRCVEIDFPIHQSLFLPLQQQNEELKNRFAVKDYPTLLILDANERMISRINDFPENGKRLADELLNVMKQDHQLFLGLQALPSDKEELRVLYQLSQVLMQEEARKTILSAGIQMEIPFFLLENYRCLIEEGKKEAALLMRDKLLQLEDYQVHFTVAMIDFQERALTMNPNEAIKPLQSYLDQFGQQDQHNVWRIEMTIAQFYLDADEWKNALKYAQMAYEDAPAQFRQEIASSMEYIRSQIR